VQFFALTEKEKSVIINHKLIITAMKKRSICGAFAESCRLVWGSSAKQRRALWSSVTREGWCVGINQRGWNRGRFL